MKRNFGRLLVAAVRKNRASALLAAVIFVTIFSMVVGSVLLASDRQTRNTYRSRLLSTSLAAAATVLNAMTEQAYYIATTRPAQLGGDFTKLDEAILSIQPKALPGYTSAKANNKELTYFAAAAANDGEYEVINDPKDDWNGFNIVRWRYRAVSFMNAEDAETSGKLDNNASRLGFQGAGFSADMEINFIPLYQYAIFYDNDLEIHNGPVMDVKGPVHSNRTLWVASGSGVNFMDRVSAAGNVRGYRDFLGVSGSTVPGGAVNKSGAFLETSDHTGNVTVRNAQNVAVKLNNNGSDWAPDTNKNSTLDGLDKNWLGDALGTFNGRLQDSSMGVKPIKPPLPYIEKPNGDRVQADAADLIQRAVTSGPNADSASMQEAKMEYKADLIIEGDPSKMKWDAKREQYSDVTLRDQAGNLYNNTIKVDGEYKSIVTPGSFYDNREQKLVNSFDVNMKEIRDRSSQLPIVNGNGLLYVSPEGGQLPSVRLTDAATMPSNLRNTMTVATDKPMYLTGDVNSASEASRKTLLLAADAITVTSQKLTEALTQNGGKPVSVGKTITNAIFMMGQVSSKYDNKDENDHFVDGRKRSSMSGGAHNVLRYLENWEGKEHQFNGSLICLFESRLATSQFWRKKGNNKLDFYNPPNRKYNWDASLKTKEPPAGMPVLVQVITNRLERVSRTEAVEMAGY